MAARIRKTKLTDSWKEKIQASMLVNRLIDHGLGKCELSATQIKAIDILLKKVAPDLKAVELTGEGGGPVRIIASGTDVSI